MADTKISALTAATTPLAGTEVLPIVQSSSTKKVSVADLTTGRTVNMLKGVFTNSGSANSSADFTNTIFQDVLVNFFSASGTTGNKITLQFASNGGATTTNSITSYNNAYGSGLDNAIDFGNANGRVRVTTSGDVAATTGNFVQGVAAKGIDFSANSTLAGKTSTLLNWYEEGTWTPTFTNCGTASASTATYTRVGRMMTVNLVFTATSLTANSSRFTLPIASGTLATGTWTRSTVEGGFLEVQASTLCYFASTPSSTTGTFTAIATYII